MFVFKAKGLSKEWNGKTLFQNVDIELRKGEHVALFGRNGTGKTTLLNGLLGKIQFDSGTVQCLVPSDDWGVLEQNPDVDSQLTTLEFVQQAAGKVYHLKKQLDKMHTQTGFNMETYEQVYNAFLALDGFSLETEAEAALQQVNLSSSVWENSYHELSGGQKTRAQLARLILQNPACIIMDEPTNHLDKETTEWLENWFINYSGAVLFVSHDRYFLDCTADAIYELNSDGCRRYEGGYASYRSQKEVEQRTQESIYRKQEQRKEELLKTIRNYQQWFQQAHKAAGQDDFARAKAKKNVSRFKAKEKELERLENNKVQKPQADKKLNVQLDGSSFSAKRLLQIEDLSFSHSKDQMLFSNLNTSIYRGDRIGVIGENGTGKSTLLKLISGKLTPDKGKIKLNPQTRIGYFAQELENLDEGKTILESMLELPNMTQSEARTILGCFLFSREAVFKKISSLSMGEKCRVAFLHLYFSNANLLVLDEPTNFFDIDTKEIIEGVLQEYPGALVIVSHDRYLIKKTANRIIELGDRDVVDYEGDYQSFLEHKNNPGKENDIRELELMLTRLMSTEAETDEEQERILAEIKRIRQLLG
ncbi:ribosomal protection-like ABC-F family protein [Virgibacillus doumboii]|uniref:ribosomal protection-like ABC-F family protein n=1 Tax=Virgibacillus doumboii TaxID=2697503 RepID=UPI0013DF6222|nr:ABC-F type ribosomal protection protein [Virgibacillus doumboii]